jgi:hypothetical protein
MSDKKSMSLNFAFLESFMSKGKTQAMKPFGLSLGNNKNKNKNSEHFIELANEPTMPPRKVLLDDASPSLMHIDVKTMFIWTPDEDPVVFRIANWNDVPSKLKAQVMAFDAKSGKLIIKPLKTFFNDESIQPTVDNALETTLELALTATNKYDNTSSPARLVIKERFTSPPLPGLPLPELIELNEEKPSQTLDLNKHFTDVQKTPPRILIQK